MAEERRRSDDDTGSIERVPVPVETRWPDGRTNAYLVGSNEALLVDPAARSPELDAAIDDRDVTHVAVTHAHSDHVGGVAEYATRCGATVWARAGRADRLFAATGVEPDRTFRDGTIVGPAVVVETPGHTADHVAFRVGDEALIGDLAVARGSVMVGGDDGDLRAYLVSLRRMRHAGLVRLHPGHGPAIDDPDTVLEQLLAHRMNRERRVLDAVRSGATTLDAITEEAYRKDLSGVADLAQLTVTAHLEKLAREGRVRWDGCRATPP